MSRNVFNRDGGAADQYGHLLALNRLLSSGDVIEGMQVQALASPGMFVIVGQGTARISTGSYPSSYGFFVGIDTTTGSPAGESVTIATAPGSNSRIDTIVAYVDLGVTPTTSPANNPGMLKLMAVAGTVAGSPTAPSGATIQAAVGASNPYIKLGNVLIGTSVTQINSGNITDMRTWTSASTRNITAPYKFSAYRASAFNGTTGSAILVFDTKLFDTGTNFSTSTGIFTAPVAGYYQFNWMATSAHASSRWVTILTDVTGSAELARGTDINVLTSGVAASNGSALVPLAAAQQVSINIFSDNTNAGQTGKSNTYFSGYLQST